MSGIARKDSEMFEDAAAMSAPSAGSAIEKALWLSKTAVWKYETDEFNGVCEIAHDAMTVKCVFESCSRSFYDVLAIDGIIRQRLLNPVSVERLAEQLSDDLPDLRVTVHGRAKTHGWISSTVGRF